MTKRKTSRRQERAENKFKGKDCGKIEKSGDSSTTNALKNRNYIRRRTRQ
jgi:hypothetical protein